MNRAASSLLISFASLGLATTASARTTMPTSSTAASPNTLVITPGSSSCPIGLRAQSGVGPGMVIVVTDNDNASQQLHLQLSNPNGSRNITHAQITVHGLTAQARISPTALGNPDASTIAKKVDLALTIAPGANASTDLLFKGFTSVRWIDLDSLVYADGSRWPAASQHTCHIVPDRFMLVAIH